MKMPSLGFELFQDSLRWVGYGEDVTATRYPRRGEIDEVNCRGVKRVYSCGPLGGFYVDIRREFKSAMPRLLLGELSINSVNLLMQTRLRAEWSELDFRQIA